MMLTAFFYVSTGRTAPPHRTRFDCYSHCGVLWGRSLANWPPIRLLRPSQTWHAIQADMHPASLLREAENIRRFLLQIHQLMRHCNVLENAHICRHSRDDTITPWRRRLKLSSLLAKSLHVQHTIQSMNEFIRRTPRMNTDCRIFFAETSDREWM
jgi:hypothetical protein